MEVWKDIVIIQNGKKYDLQGNFIKEWNSQKEASSQLGINQGSISNCCKGKAPTVGGYVWKFS